MLQGVLDLILAGCLENSLGKETEISVKTNVCFVFLKIMKLYNFLSNH